MNKHPFLIKSLLFAAFFTLFVNIVLGQKADTAVVFYKTSLDNIYPVDNRQDADFIRTMLPIDPIDKSFHIIDYFPDGKIRMGARANPQYTDIKKGLFSFMGECISYFPNGKRQSIVNYESGQKDGEEIRYFPNGNIYCTIKHVSPGYPMVTKPFFQDCYDIDENLTCKGGNGQWLIYYDDYKRVQEEGQVKKGVKDGEWKGYASLTPSIKYISKFRKGEFLSGAGYDSVGRVYSFINEFDPPYYDKKDPINFMEIFHSYFKVPRDVSGRKINMDTIYFSFVIEKDGSISNVDVLKNNNAELRNNVSDALMKCRKWSPALCYGVPLRTKLSFGYKIENDYLAPPRTDIYLKVLKYTAEIVGI